jgi:diguanylate cyclase (GGDEF)-like protein/PAS domain S-box-containing protein
VTSLPDQRLSLLEPLTDLVVGVDADGTVRAIGRGTEARLGRTRDELVGHPFTELLHPDDRADWTDALTKVTDEPTAEHRIDLRLQSSDGTSHWYECVTLNQLDAPGTECIVVACRDVAERHDTAETLRRAQDLMTALAFNSTDVLMILGPDASIGWVSPSVTQVFGFQPEDLVGTQGLDFLHPDDIADAAEKLLWLLEEPGRSQTTVWRGRHADGSWRWIEAVNVNLLDDPTIGGVIANFRDITERRRTELALTESEQRFRAVIQNSRDVTGLLDREGRVVWASPNVQDMLGFDPEAVVGAAVYTLVHPADLPAAMEKTREVLTQGGVPDPVSLRLTHADGRWVPCEVAGSTLLGADGEVEGIIINVRDIAWRVETERALRESEQRFRALVQHSSDVVIVAAADGPVVYASPAVQEVFGRAPEDLIGATASPLTHPDDRGRIRDEISRLSRSPGASTLLEYRVIDGAGRTRWVETTVTNLVEDPAVGGFVFNVRDISDRIAVEQALRDSEAMFRSVAESSPLGMYTADAEGRCIYVNERWQQITGLTQEQAVGHGWVNMVHPDDLEWLLADVGFSAFNEQFDLTYRVIRPDGETRWITVHTSPLRDLRDDRVATVGVLDDITDRVEAERDTQRLTDIFEATQDIIGISDSDGQVLYFNRAARRFLDLPLVGPLEPMNLADVFAPWSVEQLSAEIEPRMRREGIWSGELALLKPDGVEVPVSAQFLVHYDADGNLEFFSGVMRDISERKAFEHELAHQATHDPLTGLPNRILLLDQLAAALGRARRHQKALAVLFLDLDHFKVVNDSLGHSLGDRLLMSIADRLKVALRPGDTIARFGGDEFILLCEQLDDPDDAITIARRVEQALSGPFELDDAEIYVGVSIGIAFSDRDSNEPETLIRDADAAMYRAKEKGRARYEVFDSAMRASAVDRLDIENALRRALDRRQLRVHYQPIIDLGTGRVTGMEALLRWEHPERGLLLPGEFITIAEETGLIVPIGGWVLAQACRQLQRWAAEHPETHELVATVNLSGRQLSHPRLVAEVESVLLETGIDPARIDLEITESVLMDDVGMSAETLQRLKALGVKLVIDDFGTGYSSLSYLRQFPVDGMKVDRSFVDGLGTDPGDTAIVAAIVNLAHTLGLDAIAEGVETAAQLAELRELGCDAAQGFYVARPLPPEALLELVRQGPRY